MLVEKQQLRTILHILYNSTQMCFKYTIITINSAVYSMSQAIIEGCTKKTRKHCIMLKRSHPYHFQNQKQFHVTNQKYLSFNRLRSRK